VFVVGADNPLIQIDRDRKAGKPAYFWTKEAADGMKRGRAGAGAGDQVARGVVGLFGALGEKGARAEGGEEDAEDKEADEDASEEVALGLGGMPPLIFESDDDDDDA
jgi:hypothetical protein